MQQKLMKKGHKFEGEWGPLYAMVWRSKRKEIKVVIEIQSQKQVTVWALVGKQ